MPAPVPAAGTGYSGARQDQSTLQPQPLPTQPPAPAAPPALVEGRLLIATTRLSSRPKSDLPPDYRLAWWSAAGLQPLHLPEDDRGVVDAAARPDGSGIAAIVGGVTIVRADGSGGSPISLLPKLGGPNPGAVEQYLSVSWAGQDRLVVRQTAPVGISFIDPNGQSRAQTPFVGLDPVMTPDGQHLAFGYAGTNAYYSIYVSDAPFTDVRKLTRDKVVESTAAWSPDGAWLAFAAQEPSIPGSPPGWSVRTVRADGSEEQTLIPAHPGVSFSSLHWSPDGQHLAFTRHEEAAHTRQIGITTRDGSTVTMLSASSANDRVLDWIR